MLSFSFVGIRLGRRLNRLTSVVCWTGAILLLALTPLATRAAEIEYPFAVVNIASVERLRTNAGAMFESAERLDMSERVDQWIGKDLKEIKGMDRTKPFGMMLYLGAEMFSPPLGIGYFPVSNLEDALATISTENAAVTPVEGKPDRYVLRPFENVKIQLRYRNGYLFVVGPDGSDSALDREFPDPDRLTSRLSNLYDVSLSLMIRNIPEGLKAILLGYFKTQSQADLQQRDDEPESVYRMRRANGEIWIDLIEKIVNQGNEITLGAKMDPESHQAAIEIEVAGNRDSKLARFFQAMSGKKTQFGSVVSKPAVATVAVSLSIEEKLRANFVKLFEAVHRDYMQKLDEDDQPEFQKLSLPILKAVVSAAELGHVDGFAQLTGSGDGGYAVVGAIKIAGTPELPSKFADLLEFMKDSPNVDDPARQLDVSYDYIESNPVHQLPIPEPSAGSMGMRMFGDDIALHLYANPQAIWFAIGGDSAFDVLKAAIEDASQPQGVADSRTKAPFRFMTHAKRWPVREDTAEAPNPYAKRANASFASDNDELTIEVRPTDSGLRIRTEFQAGFISLMGRGITEGVENGSFRRPQRREGGQRRQPAQQSEPSEKAN